MTTFKDLVKQLSDLEIKLALAGENELKVTGKTVNLTPPLVARLKQFKPQLIELLRQTSANTMPGLQPSLAKTAPLSKQQLQIWVTEQLMHRDGQFNMTAAILLRGNLQQEALGKSINHILLANEILRTRIIRQGDDVLQIVDPFEPRQLEVQHFPGLNMQAQEKHWREILDSESQRHIQLDSEPLFCCKIFRYAPDMHVLMLTVHHIASDGWSVNLLVKEIAANYRELLEKDACQPRPKQFQYKDFALWQEQNLRDIRNSEHAHYWRKQLQDIPSAHNLRTCPVRTSGKGSRSVSVSLSRRVTEKLTGLGQQKDCTLFMVLQLLFSATIARCSREKDILMGSPVVGRDRKEFSDMIGCFINLIVLRTQFDCNASFWDMLDQTRELHIGAQQHQSMPFETLVDILNPKRIEGRHPVFQILINMEPHSQSTIDLPGLQCQLHSSQKQQSKFDLTLYIKEKDSGWNCTLHYDNSLFDETFISLIGEEFAHLCQQASNHPDKVLLAHPWRGAEPLSCISEPRNLQSLSQVFLSHATKSQASVYDDLQQLSYKELAEQSIKLANYLQYTYGNIQGKVIAVAQKRRISRLVSYLAILHCNATYLPISEDFPSALVEYQLSDANVEVVLNDGSLTEVASPLEQVQIASASTLAKINQQNAVLDHSYTLDKNTPACLIYTTGSTGQPKGVKCSHQAILNRISWQAKQFPVEPGQHCCHISSMAVIRGIWELYLPLVNGIPLRLVNRAQVREVNRLCRTLEDNQITQLVSAPSLVLAVIETCENQQLRLDNLQRWFVSGEPLHGTVIRQFQQQFPHCQLINLFGSTEVLSDVLYWPSSCSSQDTQEAIGIPVSNVSLQLVDPYRNLLPRGIIGELMVSGDSVCLGYTSAEESGKEKFIEYDGRPAYLTGDIAVRANTGEFYYIGREDQQIKIWGYRVELSEVESAVNDCPLVKAAVVKAVSENNVQHLVAYVVWHSEKQHKLDSETILNGFLADRLAHYKLPHMIVSLDKMPITTNGKINRKALPDVSGSLTPGYVPCETATELSIAEMWVDILGVTQVGKEDNFFNLGGNSLLLTRLLSQLHHKFAVKLQFKTFYRFHSLALLAQHIDDLQQSQALSHDIQIIDKSSNKKGLLEI
ncbi:MAG: condensation domain-containing protein [Aestuariibacter sp.]